ncbi:MAG TPA: hypothetical protein DD727_00360 [Clostridiales bacterium]|nr:hypothetical protein [Clostridiales bacterium]
MAEEAGFLLYHAGMRAVSENQITYARECFSSAAEWGVDSSKCLNAEGLCSYDLGDYPKARDCWIRSLQCQDQDNPARMYLEHLESEEMSRWIRQINIVTETIDRRSPLKALIRLQVFLFNAKRRKQHIPIRLLNMKGLLLCHFSLKHAAWKTWCRVLARDHTNRDAVRYLAVNERRGGI